MPHIFRFIFFFSVFVIAVQVVLQFGRVGKNRFSMDLRYPLSPMQVGNYVCFCFCFVFLCKWYGLSNFLSSTIFRSLTSFLTLHTYVQAFSICVACLDGKIADRKGYEYLRKFTSSAQAEAAEREENNAAANEAFYNNGQTVRGNSLQFRAVLDIAFVFFCRCWRHSFTHSPTHLFITAHSHTSHTLADVIETGQHAGQQLLQRDAPRGPAFQAVPEGQDQPYFQVSAQCCFLRRRGVHGVHLLPSVCWSAPSTLFLQCRPCSLHCCLF